MKRLFLPLAIIISISLSGQNRIAKGYVFDKYSNQLLESVRINVIGTEFIAYSNRVGGFSIHVPKKHFHLLISKEGYKLVEIPLKPGFQSRPLKISMEPLTNTENFNVPKRNIHEDSLFKTYKNVLTLSPLELVGGAVAVRYERFLHMRHSTGMHASIYLFGRKPLTVGSEYDTYVKFQGIKSTPFYRFYPLRVKSIGLFVEGKVPFGYIKFNELGYRYGSNSSNKKNIEYSFWSIGYGVSVGIMFKLPKTLHGVGNISIGYQYFPIDVPETIQVDLGNGTILTGRTDTDWWYRAGPGGKVDIKFTIGGIF